jgi:uncharacterized protein
MTPVATLAELEAVYSPAPAAASTVKEIDHLIPEYRDYIRLSPFVALATAGPSGLDCSPRGDSENVVKILDDTTLALPDRRGNNRIDSLRNIVVDPRVALLFLIPGSGTTFRINGAAHVVLDRQFCDSFAVDGKSPRSVIVVKIERAYFQCARAIVRSGLWDSDKHVDASQVPTAGAVLQRLSTGAINAEAYDAEWPGRAAKTLW